MRWMNKSVIVRFDGTRTTPPRQCMNSFQSVSQQRQRGISYIITCHKIECFAVADTAENWRDDTPCDHTTEIIVLNIYLAGLTRSRRSKFDGSRRECRSVIDFCRTRIQMWFCNALCEYCVWFWGNRRDGQTVLRFLTKNAYYALVAENTYSKYYEHRPKGMPIAQHYDYLID